MRNIYGCVPYKNKHERKLIERKLKQEYGSKIEFQRENKQLIYKSALSNDFMFIQELTL